MEVTLIVAGDSVNFDSQFLWHVYDCKVYKGCC